MELKHIDDNNQSPEELNTIWETAKSIKELYYCGKAGKRRLKKIAEGKNIISLFNQPSTRTRLKFGSAAKMLGANMEIINEITHTSTVKGENWYNTLRTFSEKEVDVLTIRHPENYVPRRLAALCRKYNFRPKIISGGDGNHLHPTQAIGDGFTIKEHFKERFGKETLKIAIGADPKNARVLHSLARLLANFPVELTIVSWRPEYQFKMPRKYLQEYIKKNGFPREVQELPEGEKFDVIYWVRFQMEHAPKDQKEEWQREYNLKCRVNPRFLNTFLKPDGIFLHPGPRTEEIDIKIDSDPRVKDGEQMRNGDFTVAALYALMLNPEFPIPKTFEI